MKLETATHTSTLLELDTATESNAVFYWIAGLFGFLFVAGAGCFVDDTIAVKKLECHRDGMSGTCQLNRDGLFSSTDFSHPLHTLRDVQLKDRETPPKLLLIGHTFTEPLALRQPDKKPKEIVEKLRDFLENSDRQSFAFEQPPEISLGPALPMLVGLLALVLYLVGLIRWTTVRFDKSDNRIVIRRRALLGGETVELTLDSIRDVWVKARDDTHVEGSFVSREYFPISSWTDGDSSWRLELKPVHDLPVPLTNGFSTHYEQLVEIRDTIESFLDLDETDDTPPDET